MENGTTSLIHNLLSETLDYYGQFDTKLKVDLSKNLAYKYGSLHRCFLTSKHFPDPNDKRIATHYGYFIDPDNIAHFFGDQHTDQKAKLIKPVLQTSFRIATKFRELNVREIEIAALANTFIWNERKD